MSPKGRFQRPDERPDEERAVSQTNDWIGGELTRAVIRDLAAALGPDQLDVAGGQLGRARQDVARVGVAAERQDRLVLQQQQLVSDRACGTSCHEAMLEIPCVAIPRPAEPPRGDRRGCGGESRRRVLCIAIHVRHDIKRRVAYRARPYHSRRAMRCDGRSRRVGGPDCALGPGCPGPGRHPEAAAAGAVSRAHEMASTTGRGTRHVRHT